jgi:signal transduction histidine kinase
MKLSRFVPGLYGRLALVFTSGFVLFLSGVLCWSHYVEKTARQQAEQKLHLDLAQQIIAKKTIIQNGVIDRQAVVDAMNTLGVLGPSFDFYLLAPDGEVLIYSSLETPIQRKRVGLDPIVTLIKNPTFIPQFADDPRSRDKQQIFSVTPIIHQEILIGYFYVVIGSQQAESVRQPLLATWKSKQVALVFIISGIFLLLSLLILFAHITKPLRILQQNIRLVMANNFSVTAPMIDTLEWHYQQTNSNEIGQLHRDFISCIRQISMQWQQLQLLEQQRKTLLVDLSHDLRTPLMALHGQLEWLSEHSEFHESTEVSLALSRSKQVQRLVEQVFELAVLEASEAKLQVENICLNELSHDIASRYRIEAKAKHIQLELHCPKNYCVIQTDVGKLERVIVNLLDNAFRHTGPAGVIQLTILVKPDGFELQIRDSGCGIHPDDLPHLFTRGFRARNSINDKQLHKGLGLAINAKLCQILGIDIAVNSQLGHGTNFKLNFRVSIDLHPELIHLPK